MYTYALAAKIRNSFNIAQGKHVFRGTQYTIVDVLD